MSATNQHKPDTFVVERHARPVRVGHPVPLLASRVEHVLRALLTSAMRDPHNWHAVPGYDLAIRVMLLSDCPTGVAFEIRSSSKQASVHRYRYSVSANTLGCWDYEQVVHPNLTANEDLPSDPEKLAHLIAAIFRARPESIETSTIPSPGLEPERAVTTERPGFGPLSYAFTDVVRHITANWFGGRETTWSRPLRLFYAFLGSFTFFAMQSFVLRYDKSFTDVFTSQTNGQSPDSHQPSFLLSVDDLSIILIALSALFAFISGYIDRQHGPVRLYLGGFLLPYFIWALIVFVNR